MEPIDYRKIAEDNFLAGYNCSQSVVLSFSDLLDIDRNVLSKIACSFGGGMGRLREVCGAVSGAFIVLGLVFGYSGPEKGKLKTEQYIRVQEIAKRAEEKYGSIVCRDLLGLNVRHDEPFPEARTPDFYKKRPCRKIIGDVSEILAEYLSEKGIKI